jgi:DNA polymerase-3 subunit beta
MTKFLIDREHLLHPLQQVIGVIERRQTLPILSNVLIRLGDNRLECTGTDLELQLIATQAVETQDSAEITVPARKLLDICRLLPEQSRITFEISDAKENLSIRSGHSRFSLATLPASSYPQFDASPPEQELSISSRTLKKALDKTIFSMAVQDVRYYLNGLLLDLSGRILRAVSSDGHRLALHEEEMDQDFAGTRQIIVPRKGVLELTKLLHDEDTPVHFQFSPNTVRVLLGGLVFSAKLIEGKFPDYRKVLPKDLNRVLTVNRNELKLALSRVSILSNEKFKGIRFDIKPGVLQLNAHNPDNEEAEEEVAVHYEGDFFSVGFNASYILDAVNNVDSEEMRLSFTNAASSCLIEDVSDHRYRFVVMPMKL